MEWWVYMPKVELHAHLNGSVRDSTLLELARVLGDEGVIVFSDVEHVIMKDDRSLHEVFKLFDLIHILTTDHKTVTRITKEVVEDFAYENVVYLELRTTPKKNDSKGMSKRSYMEAVMEGLRAVTAVDVDFAPQSLDARTSLNRIPMNGTCHGATRRKIYVPNHEEIQMMLDFLPNRIGHACCFSEEDWRKLKSSKIPVEICLTSNIRTNTISSLDIHHFVDLYNAKHPVILCTDDSGVFSTSLSKEYSLASSAFGLGKKELFQLARNGIDYIFADDEVKGDLTEIFSSAAKELDL
ncbi:hypothetical protein P3X46_020539 [Hevea brasiliensis]|uniref:Adenosine deaminase domain-containing protein n=1 Tax=Hevea brasiliensis TaxID=3981 RepID=A0ABQ9LR57_HEVBR|nr:hypothetical protein P3X46_020539 [Hevea brasiliensis]